MYKEESLQPGAKALTPGCCPALADCGLETRRGMRGSLLKREGDGASVSVFSLAKVLANRIV